MCRYHNINCVVYTGDTDVTSDQILQTARQRFNIVLPRAGPCDVHFVFLKRREWVEAVVYPYFTLLGQSFGSLILGFEALLNCVPDVYIDTMGYAFTIPLFRYLGGCRTACYVHYPTISTDMLELVARRRGTYNNATFISSSRTLSYAKLIYYRLFAYLYGVAGKRTEVVMVNSSWTLGHILALWCATDRTHIVYPPCDVREFITIPLDRESATRSVISVAQFRPEKDHPLQLRAFRKFLDGLPEEGQQQRSDFRLILVGSCRNAEDYARVKGLKVLAHDEGIDEQVDFHLNEPFDNLKKYLSEAIVGLHTMWNEHFGIGKRVYHAYHTVIIQFKLNTALFKKKI